MIEQILGWLGNIGFLLGGIWLAQKKAIGFYAQFLANCLYIIQSYIVQNNSLFWLSIILGIFNLYGIYKWKNKC